MDKHKASARPEVLPNQLVQKPLSRSSDQLEPARDIVFWEEHNPMSLINLVSDRMRELMRKIPPAYLAMDEEVIRKKLDPSWVQDQLRLCFWDEYFLTIDNNERAMRIQAIYGKVCSKETFYNNIEKQLFLAYLTKPPTGYILQMRSLLNMATERMREVLKLPLKDYKGNVNTKLIAEVVKIATLVDNRVKGAVTQRIQIDGTQKNLNVNINQYEAPKTHQDLDKELRELEKELASLQIPLLPRQIKQEDEFINVRDTIEIAAIKD